MGLQKIIVASLLIASLCATARADSTIQPEDYAQTVLLPYLKANADSVAIRCGDPDDHAKGSCVISWMPRQGVPIAFEDVRSTRDLIAAKCVNIKILTAQLRDKGLTDGEKAELLAELAEIAAAGGCQK